MQKHQAALFYCWHVHLKDGVLRVYLCSAAFFFDIVSIYTLKDGRLRVYLCFLLQRSKFQNHDVKK